MGGKRCNNENPRAPRERAARTLPLYLSLFSPPLSLPSSFPSRPADTTRDATATATRVGCSFAVYTTLGGPSDGTSTETADPTMDHSTRGWRTIPMLTAFHAKCRGSRLQSGERSPSWIHQLATRTRVCIHTHTHTLNAQTRIRT